METRNWKLETGNWKLGAFVSGNPRAGVSVPASGLADFPSRVSSFQFPVSNFRFARLALALSTTCALFADSATLQAQGCAMCYNTAAAAKAAAIQALRSGILILLVPVVLMFIGIFIVAFRSKERFNEFETRNWKLETGDSPADRRSAIGCEFRVFPTPRREGANFEFRNPGRTPQI